MTNSQVIIKIVNNCDLSTRYPYDIRMDTRYDSVMLHTRVRGPLRL